MPDTGSRTQGRAAACRVCRIDSNYKTGIVAPQCTAGYRDAHINPGTLPTLTFPRVAWNLYYY